MKRVHSEDPKFCGATAALYCYQVLTVRCFELLYTTINV